MDVTEGQLWITDDRVTTINRYNRMIIGKRVGNAFCVSFLDDKTYGSPAWGMDGIKHWLTKYGYHLDKSSSFKSLYEKLNN